MASTDRFENNNLPDHANVAIHPPILFGILLIIGFGLRAIVPIPFLPDRLAWGVIAREEVYLQRKFGAQYSAYRDKVRRWL